MGSETRIFVDWGYNRKRKKSGITDEQLREIAEELIADPKGGSLGGGVFKKRIALEAGTSGGARTVVAYHQDDRVYFLDGWEKKDVKPGKKEIDDLELRGYKLQSKVVKDFTDEQIKTVLKARIYTELPPAKAEKKDD
ncbi:TPA: type II toxin-antitoxin system RelE/ParE family toxin [Enterobacter hormaechei subsp. xiangfangensis]